MVDPRVLEKFGCTKDRLQKLFQAGMPAETPAQVSMDASQPPPDDKRPKTDGERRRAWEYKIRSRLYDGIGANLRAARPNQAVDMAWDSPPIQRHTIPLLMWAQGKLKIEQAYSNCVASSGQAQADKFFRKTESNGQPVISLNQQRITDISIDLLRSYVTRRHAAMDALWSNLWPLFKYDPRGTDDVALLRADALSQRVDIISDAYNYRHFFSQCRRQMLLYGWSIAFPRAAWDRQIAWRFEPTNTGEPSEKVESYVTREGIDFINPHPSRIFYDLQAPLANINTDTGPSFIGYWDIVRWGSLLGPSAPFYNLDHVFLTTAWSDLINGFPDFFPYYFDPCVLKMPDCTGPDPSLWNERDVNIGKYSATAKDVGVLVTHYFERINPLHEGIGKYDADVWIHLTVAGDCTVIGGEFLPGLPGCYGAVNWNDGRLANQSMGMALLGYQDQASNIMSSMLMQLRTSLIQLWLLDKDSLDPDIIEEFKKNAGDADWWVERKVLVYSASKFRDLGVQDPRQAFGVVQAQIQNVFEAGLKALTQLLNLADRLLILSPNELGQPNPREVSAREVSDIATSVQAMYAFINQGPREQVAGAKELIYDSLICHGTPNFRVPITKRYTRDVIKRAGMQIPPDVEVIEMEQNGKTFVPVNTPVMGNLRNLVYDYYFDSRDGAERVQNTQGAQVVMQLLQSILQIPPLAQKMGLRNIMDAANIVIRMSGAPWNFQFELPQGGDDSMPADQAAPGADPAAQQQQQQSNNQMQMLDVKIERIGGMLMQLLQGGAGAAPAPPQQPGATARLQEPLAPAA
jgi:hypothetical protein